MAPRLTLLLTVLLAALFAGCACGSEPSPGEAPPLDAGNDSPSVDAGSDAALFDAGFRPPATLQGDLRFEGCAPAVGSVDVHLRPIRTFRAGTRASGAVTPPAVTSTVRAVVTPTADAHILHFAAEGLVTGDLHQLGVDVRDVSCPLLKWRGPRAGLVVAGTAPVQFDALAVHTRLEVLGPRAGGDTWVSRDFLRPGDTTRRFRWNSDLAGVTAVDLQFASERFDLDSLTADAACSPPRGLLTSQRAVHTATRPDEVAINVAALLAAPPAGATDLERVRWDQIRHRRAPLYVRAVPVGATEQLCAPLLYGAASWVELVSIEDDPPPPVVFGPPVGLSGSYDNGALPWTDPLDGATTCYTVVTAHTLPTSFNPLQMAAYDGMSWAIVFGGLHPYGYTMPVGESFCYTPPSGGSSSWFDDVVSTFSDAVTGFVDAISFVVDSVSSLYSEIRNAVVDMVAYALASVVGCPSWCHTLLQAAAEYALVALGLPPSLPNFDQLVDQGVDYLAAEVAAQTGVPEEVITGAVDIAKDMAKSAKANRGIPGMAWLIEDTGFRPSSVMLDVRRNPLGTPTKDLFVGGATWAGSSSHLHVPTAPAAPAIRMPVTLSPDYTGITPPDPLIPAIPAFNIPPYYGSPQRVRTHFQLYWSLGFVVHSCVRFYAIAVDYSGPVPVLVQPYADLSTFNTPVSFTDPYEQLCTP